MDNEIDSSWKCLRPLFPDLTDQELKEVEETFYGYLEIALRIFQRMEAEREPKGVLGTAPFSEGSAVLHTPDGRRCLV